jgi:MoaA/NifB/PqqE/SkfB family radical SAM enzyme
MFAAPGKLELPVIPEPAEAPALPQNKHWSSTFCVDPWTQFIVQRSGEVRVCCYLQDMLRGPDGKPLSIYQDSLENLWNSDMLRQLRSDLANGQPSPLCGKCQAQEQAGLLSLRQHQNLRWKETWLNTERLPLELLRARGSGTNYHLSDPPVSLTLNLGNECNLKCRMCTTQYSSGIEQDPVHSRWHPGAEDVERLPGGQPWYRNSGFIREQVLRHRKHIKVLNLIGGESLFIKEARSILEDLIADGLAGGITLVTTTNGTLLNSSWLHLARQFKSLLLVMSIDGTGDLYEYIRFPASWETVSRNLRTLKKLPRTSVVVSVVVQNYNALNLVELFRFLDALGVEFYTIPVMHWDYLHPTNMPAQARQAAAQRLRDYAAADCRPAQRPAVLGLAEMLAPAGGVGELDFNLARKFMLFTNDLDRTRGQSFRATCGELYQSIAETGFDWTDQTYFANPAAAIPGVQPREA